MINQFAAWPARPHPVLAAMLAVAFFAMPVLLPYTSLADLKAGLFAYTMACVLVYPVCATLRRRVTSLPWIWAIAAVLTLGLCFFHTNILAESANLPWPAKRDITLNKFLASLPQMSAGVACWWLLVTLPDRRQPAEAAEAEAHHEE